MKNQIIRFFPVLLLGYHLLFAFVAWNFVVHSDGDALRYWFVGQDLSEKIWFSFFHSGTDMVKIITFPPVKYLHLPFWSGFVLFSLFSYLGFYRLWKLIISITEGHQVAFYAGIVLLLLPNLHVWTSFIGKESLLFVALVFMTEKVLHKNVRSISFILSFLVIALIRPHVAIVLLIALIIAYFWKGQVSWRNKMYFGLVSAAVLAALYFMLKKIAFITANPWDRIVHVYDYHIKALQKTTAYVPLEEYSFPYKMFTFYYRPLPFEKTGWFYQIWSVENLILLLLSSITLYFIVRNLKVISWDLYKIFAIFAMFFLGIMYVFGYANYGLIARTKIMAMPFLYILIVKIISKRSATQPQP